MTPQDWIDTAWGLCGCLAVTWAFRAGVRATQWVLKRKARR